MVVKCKQCNFKFNYNLEKKETMCPRCGKIYFEAKGCENCKGCSLTNNCKGK